MISILIPVFNYDVSDLVSELDKQIKSLAIKVEIIIVDDASTISYNENLSKLSHISYEKLDSNYGRSKIRNYLASLAQYDYLLFIDCDAKIVSDLFLKNYIDCIQDNRQVACGGLVYNTRKPENHKLYFRWYYGINREFRSVAERIKNPNKSFSSFNFLIRKDIFSKIRFNEDITTYGHEDTLLGIELGNQNVNIQHIDNPLLHDGLEDTSQFIAKTNQSIKNLKHLVVNYSEQYSLANSIKLVRYILFVKRIKLVWFLKLSHKIFGKLLINNLLSKHPSLIVYDFYKICYYFSI